MHRIVAATCLSFLLSTTATANNLETIKNLAGCYLVDYSYSETEVIDPSYTLDPRVYDSTRFTVKEWITVADETDNSVRLQHFMQADSFAGDIVFMMRHHGEIWTENADHRYRFIGRFNGQDRWQIEEQDGSNWVRAITNLDDGLRYQCVGNWLDDHSYPRFECAAFSPIPGRETRDMGRSDYNTLDRTAEITIYGDNWLERQNNTKTQFSAKGTNPLVREVGKIWQARLPDSECNAVKDWAAERQDFYAVLNEAWQSTFATRQDFTEIKEVNGTTRGVKINALLNEHYRQIGSDSDLRDQVYTELLNIIEAHRE